MEFWATNCRAPALISSLVFSTIRPNPKLDSSIRNRVVVSAARIQNLLMVRQTSFSRRSLVNEALVDCVVQHGYGSIHLPARAGSYIRYVPLFAPQSSTLIQQIMAWAFGTPPEFFDSKFVSQNEGREVTRVRSAATQDIVE